MKESVSIILLFFYTLSAVPAEAQNVPYDFDTYQLSFLSTAVSGGNTIPSKPDLISDKKPDSFNRKGIVSGSIMFFSGGVLCLTGHILAEQRYDNYKRSAFTENTENLREEVTAFTMMQIGGGVIGGAGLLVLVFSF
ncbi:MAG: hypothetical protein ACLFSB_16080 [Chitinispirillaceae bacterium]